MPRTRCSRPTRKGRRRGREALSGPIAPSGMLRPIFCDWMGTATSPAQGNPPVQNSLMWHSDGFHGRVMRYSSPPLIFKLVSSPKETTMKEWLKPEITESEAGMEVTSYLPAELDRA